MELKLSKKVSLDSYSTTVKKVLLTEILEGARVKYVSLHPVIKRYLELFMALVICVAVLCATLSVHAGGAKTQYLKNHIHLKNGKPIYSIIEELKTSPLGLLGSVVIAGSSFNGCSFNVWKASLGYCDGLISTDGAVHTVLVKLLVETHLLAVQN